MNAVRAAGWWTCLGLSAALAGPAFGQSRVNVQGRGAAAGAGDDGGELALPDIAAIERGAQARASVSFGGPLVTGGEASGPGAPGGPSVPTLPSSVPGGVASGPRESRGVTRLQSAQPAPEFPAGIYGLDHLAAEAGPPGGAPAGPAPEHHVVAKGDTLWSLCQGYFGDPWCWPRLWALNPHVTNPHWIFPGDVVRLRAPGEAPPPPPSTGYAITTNRRGSLDSRAVSLRAVGFVEASSMAESGRITGSREEKIMLATGDQAYVAFPAGKPLRAGERYTVFVAEKDHPVRDPDTGRTLGYLVKVYGDILVDQVTEKNVARGTLLDAVQPIERGFAVSPHVRQFRRVEPRPAAVSLEARVVASFTPVNMLSADTFVVLGRGKKDGLEVGNRSFVVRRGDGYRPVMDTWDSYDPNFPKEVVGELWVVDVAETTAIAWIARTSKEIRVGELTELRRGY
jgi:hypothetical protein